MNGQARKPLDPELERRLRQIARRIAAELVGLSPAQIAAVLEAEIIMAVHFGEPADLPPVADRLLGQP